MSNQNQHGRKPINKSTLKSIFSRARHNVKLHSRKGLILIPTAATLGILALVSVLFTSADTASNTYAANLGSQITTEVDGQYYVTLTAPDVNFSVSPSKNQNAAKQRIDVDVETNVAGGAKLYLSMASASNSLHLNGNTAQASPVIAAVPDNTDASSFPANTWGYSTDDQTYSAVPTSDSDPALLAAVDGSSVGSSAGGVITASVPVYYAANVDTSIPAGSYSNRMTYSAVVDGGIITSATLTKIEIDGSEVENMQPEVENTLTVTTNLMTNTYGTPRVYYETTSPAGYAECSDVTVGRNDSGYMTITCKVTPTQAATGVTLHIVPKGSSDDRFCTDNTYQPDTSDCEAGDWKWGSFVVEVGDITESLPQNFTEIEYMQHMTPEICASANNGDTKQLIDRRDNKAYWVAKLADGNCWMTQNLDLDLSTGTTLTPADTNIPSNWTPRTSTTTTISGYGSDTGRSYDAGNQAYEGTYNASDPTTAHYLVGNYYQWSAATAGYTGTSQSTRSICPAGWTLPSQSQFQQLVNTGLSRDNFMNAPYYLLRGGYLYGSSLYSAGEEGRYWSSTPSGSGYANYLYFASSDVNIWHLTERSYGFSARCVAAG